MRAATVGIGVLVGLLCASYADTAVASPEDLFGYGARTGAMGATGTAHASSYEVAWHNPALASTLRSNRLTLGYGGLAFSLDAVGPGLPGRVSTTPSRGFYVGAEMPIPLRGRLRDRVGVAFGFYTPSDVIARGRVLHPEKTQFPILDNRAQSLTVRLGLGVDIGWGIRAGVGIAALAEIAGNVVAATDATGRVGTEVENQLVATYAPSFGASYDLPAKLRLGMTYRGELVARFAVVVDGSKLSSLQIPLFNISGLAQYDPAQVAIELARSDPDRRKTLALQLVYKKWSDFPGLIEATIVCSEGPGSCGLQPPKVDWQDTFTVRLGAEQGFELAPDVVLNARAGMFVETSALPSNVATSEAFDVASRSVSVVPTKYFDSTRVALTAGVGVSLKKRVDLDFFTQRHALVARTIVSGESKGESAGSVTVWGLTAGVKF